jgi:hypothetical protein
METPKEKAAQVLFNLLYAEYNLVKHRDYRSEIHDEDDPKILDAYSTLLQSAAKPVINYLEGRGYCNGVSFPYNT